MSDDDWEPPHASTMRARREELSRARAMRFHREGLSIHETARLLFEISTEFFLLMLQKGSLIATGRGGSDDQPYGIIEPAAWYRLNIVDDGLEGVAQDRYGTVYFDLLVHPDIAAAKRTLAPADAVRVSPYDAIADRL